MSFYSSNYSSDYFETTKKDVEDVKDKMKEENMINPTNLKEKKKENFLNKAKTKLYNYLNNDSLEIPDKESYSQFEKVKSSYNSFYIRYFQNKNFRIIIPLITILIVFILIVFIQPDFLKKEKKKSVNNKHIFHSEHNSMVTPDSNYLNMVEPLEYDYRLAKSTSEDGKTLNVELSLIISFSLGFLTFIVPTFLFKLNKP